MQLSNRILSMQASPIRKLVPIAEKAKKSGKKVYHLNIGQPDIETPKVFFDALKHFDEKVLAYSSSHGDLELIKAMVDYYKKYGIDYEPSDIIITNGGSEALLFAIIAVADPEEEVLVPEPFYTNYNGFSVPVGVTVKPITTSPLDGFRLPAKADLVKVINPRTRAILLSNPGNPTGVVYTRDEITMLAEVAKEHDLFIIADEVYREFIYGDLEYTSFGTIEEIEDRVIIVDSISKRYSACGARIGSIASKNKELMANMMKLAQSRLCVPTIEQVGAKELYKVDPSYFKGVNDEYRRRRDLVFKMLREIPGVIVEEPKGAFYMVVKLPVDNAEEFVIWMLEDFQYNNATVMMAPAEGFYATPGLGVDEVRIAYVLNEDDLKASMEILKRGLESYPGKK
ncbi:MAG: aspartate aminotransferase [delta proteobacterium ML8_F1]|nr:MAG: aspartate aminotransferase [delta proteobacterium ML8_F1]